MASIHRIFSHYPAFILAAVLHCGIKQTFKMYFNNLFYELTLHRDKFKVSTYPQIPIFGGSGGGNRVNEFPYMILCQSGFDNS